MTPCSRACRRSRADTGVCVAFTVSEPDADGWRAMYLVGPQGVLAKHRQTHKPPGAALRDDADGRRAVAGRRDGDRARRTDGRGRGLRAGGRAIADAARRRIILWCADDPRAPMSLVARSRADENRVFVTARGGADADGATMIVTPSGAVLAQALEGRELACQRRW